MEMSRRWFLSGMVEQRLGNNKVAIVINFW